MTDTSSEQASSHHHPLHVAIVPGMPVCVMTDGSPGTVAGITQAFCIYRIDGTDSLAVANWRDIAVGNICPAPTLLPTDITENDRRNASATVLRELIGLEHVAELTPGQSTTLKELVRLLCDA